ncbi:MAG: flgE [Pelosinus sp.]|nr:flgE [Pelosinus sp.]
MRSLFSGVSGLKNSQTRMDVVGNNISNVNTIGFKSGRVTFQDMLSQTLNGAASAQGNRGGTNPKQIGLGMGIASIDTLFTDGSVQSTGKNTDLCISGNGFFILGEGDKQYYSRAGAFEFDSAGNYVVPGSGLKVQGWMADAKGVINSNAGVADIVVPVGKTMAAVATTEGTYSKNLAANATSGTTTTAGLTQAQVLKNLGLTSGTDYTAVTGLTTAGTITLTDGTTVICDGGSPALYTTKVTKTTKTITPDLTEKQVINNLGLDATGTDAMNIANLATNMPTTPTTTLSTGEKVTYDAVTGKYTIDRTGLTTSAQVLTNLKISAGSTDETNIKALGTTTIANGTVSYNGSTYTATVKTPGLTKTAALTKLGYGTGSEADNAMTSLGAGKSVTLTTGEVISYDGTNFTTTVTSTGLNLAGVQSAAGYTTGSVDETAVNNLSTAKTITLAGGATVTWTGTGTYATKEPDLLKAQVISKLGLTSGNPDYTKVTDLNSITLIDGTTKVSYDGIAKSYTTTTSKAAAATAVASFVAYDSEGVKHTITGTFTKSATPNQWDFTAGTATDTGCRITGGTGSITFDDKGNYLSSTVTGISFSPSDAGLGGATSSLALDFTGMTQFDGDTTIAVTKDGNTAGSLDSVSLNSSGVIVGSFSNGLTQDLAKVAMATFNNPGGLTKSGTNLYSQSNNSGDVQINSAGTGGAGTLTPSSLEMSNVDLSEEFSNMIVTQRGFQSNSKIITVSDEMLETLVNLKR